MADVAIPAIVDALPGTGEAVRWSASQRIGFRFVCSYFSLYCLPGPFTSIPGGHWRDAFRRDVARRLALGRNARFSLE
jgi:hypothetical protein